MRKLDDLKERLAGFPIGVHVDGNDLGRLVTIVREVSECLSSVESRVDAVEKWLTACESKNAKRVNT